MRLLIILSSVDSKLLNRFLFKEVSKHKKGISVKILSYLNYLKKVYWLVFFLISGIYWNQSNEDQRSPSLNIFKSVNLSNYEVFINKHTVRKDKGTKDSKTYWKKSSNHW